MKEEFRKNDVMQVKNTKNRSTNGRIQEES
jgi:hypothetical protein